MKKIFLLFFFSLSPFLFAQEEEEIFLLEKNSMLYQAKLLSQMYSGKKKQWQHAYGMAQPKKTIELASVWFSAYPPALIVKPGQSALQLLGSEDLWKFFQDIGIQGLSTGPLQISDASNQAAISYAIDPLFGNKEEYQLAVKIAKKHGAILIADLIPGHTGKGPDFCLALKNYQDYPGLYHMVEIEKEDWLLLPEVEKGLSSINLSSKEVSALKRRHYIAGEIQGEVKTDKEKTNWNATSPIPGVDGKKRRWVYLHAQNSEEPDLNWLDPSLAAERLLSGSIIQSLAVLGSVGVRLEADAYQGIEPVKNTKKAWSKSHPLSLTATEFLAQLTRKLGGFSFQTLNLPLESIAAFSDFGADLNYDYLLRYAALSALLHKDASFLLSCYELLSYYGLKPIQFIHALQNEAPLTDELKHLESHPEEKWTFLGREYPASLFSKKIQEENRRLITENCPYNTSSQEGYSTTLLGIIAASLQIKNIHALSPQEKEAVQKAHLLLAFLQALQPGVFTLSGWDLRGALPLLNGHQGKGAYDLLGDSPSACASLSGLPRAAALYDPLPKQLKDPSSFASQLKMILKVRRNYGIDQAELISLPKPGNPSLFFMLHRLPTGYLQLTAVNFGEGDLQEEIEIEGVQNTSAINLFTRKLEDKEYSSKKICLKFSKHEGKALLFQPRYAEND